MRNLLTIRDVLPLPCGWSVLSCLTIDRTRRFLADLAVAHILTHMLSGPPLRIPISATARGLDDETVALAQRRDHLRRDDILAAAGTSDRSEEHTSELQSQSNLV